METIQELFDIDFAYVFLSVFAILLGIKSFVSIFEWIVNKLGIETKFMRRKREEHELLVQTSQNLLALQKKHEEDVLESDTHDENIHNELTSFMSEMKESILTTQNEICQLAENRKNDRAQSLQIQKELTDSQSNLSNKQAELSNLISETIKSGISRDKQITSLMLANKELLAEKINDKYKFYISIKGIPEDEVDEFTNLHAAYKGCGGNHSGDAKYEYVMKHLPVIPVETKLILEKEDQ